MRDGRSYGFFISSVDDEFFASRTTIVQLGYNYMHIFSAKDTEALFVSFILSLLRAIVEQQI